MSLIAPEPVQQGELVLAPTTSAIAVLTDRAKFDAFYDQVKAKTDELRPNTSTKKGRDEIRSMARKVTTMKTSLDAHRKKLTEDARAQIAKVNAAGSDIWDKLDALATEVRKPLTDWEVAEEARQDRCGATMARLTAAGIVRHDEAGADVAARLAEIAPMLFEDAEWEGLAAGARHAQSVAVDALQAALVRLEKEEADRAELARLREEAAERQRQDEARAEAARVEAQRVAAEQAAAAEAKRREEAETERQRIEAERAAQAERDHAAAVEAAAENARQETAQAAERERLADIARLDQEREAAEQAVESERKRVADAHAAELARVQREADEERERVARIERDRLAEVERVAAEQRRREADRAHRGKVMGAAKEAIMEHGKVEEEAARLIVLAITGGNVPHVQLQF